MTPITKLSHFINNDAIMTSSPAAITMDPEYQVAAQATTPVPASPMSAASSTILSPLAASLSARRRAATIDVGAHLKSPLGKGTSRYTQRVGGRTVVLTDCSPLLSSATIPTPVRRTASVSTPGRFNVQQAAAPPQPVESLNEKLAREGTGWEFLCFAVSAH